MPNIERLQALMAEHASVLDAMLESCARDIAKAAQEIHERLHQGGKVLLFGNGGSASDAQHIAAELVGRFRRERPGLPAISLVTDTSILTAVSNDYGFENVFSRQVEALARPGDVAIAISTSGRSPNVLNGLQAATSIGCWRLGLTSWQAENPMRSWCDVLVEVPSQTTARIQEMHILVGHALCELLDESA